MEHEKAQKKIQETAKKTDELINLRKRNDERFMRVSVFENFNLNFSRSSYSLHMTKTACIK